MIHSLNDAVVYDTAVVGGGIAGATTVIALAKAGKTVAWFRPSFVHPKSRNGKKISGYNGKKVSGYKVGESLAPAANTILSELGLSHLLAGHSHRPSNATFSAWGQSALVERNSVVHLEGAGHVIDRVKFEKDLLLMAEDACSIAIEGTLQTVCEEQGIWQLSTYHDEQVKAHFAIDASGRSQVIGKALIHEGHAKNTVDDHLVAAYGFFPQKKNASVEPTPATLIESVENGWWYASLLPSGCLSVNFYSDSDIMPKGVTSDLNVWLDMIKQTKQIAYWIEDAEFEVSEPPSLASAATRWLAPAANVFNGAGWAAIGDAAVAFDPLSAHGMTTALWAASRMPDIVEGYFDGDFQALNNYSNAVEVGRKAYFEQRSMMYTQERRFYQSRFWERRRQGMH